MSPSGSSQLGPFSPLGDLFPDDDPAYKDADSRVLLKDVMGRIKAAGYRASNIDVIVHAEKPKMSPYKQKMAESIAMLTGLSPEYVSVKAKTNEGMGALGSTDAIACTTVAAVAKLD